MAISKNTGRAQIMVAHVDIAFGNIASGVAAPAIEVPAGAVVVGGDLVVTTVWNSVTSDVITVGDSLSAARYLASTTIAAAARLPLVPTGYKYLVKDNIAVTWTGVGTAPSTGAARLTVHYIRLGQAHFSQGMVARGDGTLA